MAKAFDRGPCKGIKMMCIGMIVLLLTSQGLHVEAKKHKHPPVLAFFQGHCSNNFCDQRCRDIDNGGFACECYEGYQLNHDGITCSKITKGKPAEDTVDLAAPEIVKLVSADGKVKLLNDIDEESTQTSADKDHLLVDNSNIHHINIASLDNTVDDSGTHKPNFHQVDVNGIKLFPEGVPLNRIFIDNNGLDPKRITIQTFDHKSEAPGLQSESLVASETQTHDRNLHNLVPDPIPQRRHDKTLWNKEDSTKKWSSGTKCDEFSCLNGGKCVDDGTVNRNKVRCDCPLGYVGERCEKEVEVRYPRFYGNSYLALPVLKNGYKELEILLEFKPIAQYGLLFFSSEFEDARSDFFALSLIDGYVQFRYDCGTGMGLIQSTSQVIIGDWNTLKVHREDSMATLWLNNDDAIHGSSKGSYSRLTLRLNLFIGGYMNMEAIKDKVGTVKGFLGCVEQVIVNDYKYDLRKADLVGDAQFGANVGECSAGVCDSVTCRNNGLCQVISAETHVCLCPIGTGGENCQHVNDVHIPEFQGHSYLEYPGLGRSALLFLEIELVIKPTKPDGVILYNGYTVDRLGDFISLSLSAGYLEFRFDLGTGPAILRSPNPITLNNWHWIKISRTGLEGILEIDHEIAAIGQSQGAFTQLTITQNLFIGGHRNYDETSKLANVTSSFDGCIQKVVINNHLLQLMDDAIFGVNIENCEHPCVGQPCLNGGECIPRRDIYTCSCPLGSSGHNCQRKIEKQLEAPKFSSDSFLIYTQKKIAKRVGGDKVDIKFAMKPQGVNGVILWSGPDSIQSTSDYLALGLVDGALQFRYNLGSGEAIITYNNTRLFDGLWHYIHAQRDKQDGFLSVDGREIVEGSSKGSYTMLNTNKVLYIGGMSDVSHKTMRKFTVGYSGCLQNMLLSEDSTLNLLQSAEDGRNVVSCS